MMQSIHSHGGGQDTIVQRLRKRIRQAQDLGFEIRNEWLDGLESTWCELAGVKILFIDLSKNAVEQLEQVDAAIAWYQQQSPKKATGSLQGNRAA